MEVPCQTLPDIDHGSTMPGSAAQLAVDSESGMLLGNSWQGLQQSRCFNAQQLHCLPMLKGCVYFAWYSCGEMYQCVWEIVGHILNKGKFDTLFQLVQDQATPTYVPSAMHQ